MDALLQFLPMVSMCSFFCGLRNWYRVLCSWHDRVFGIGHLVLGAWSCIPMVFGIGYLVFGIGYVGLGLLVLYLVFEYWAVWYWVFGIGCWICGYWVFGTWYSVVRYWVFGIGYLVPGVWYWIVGIRYLVLVGWVFGNWF